MKSPLDQPINRINVQFESFPCAVSCSNSDSQWEEKFLGGGRVNHRFVSRGSHGWLIWPWWIHNARKVRDLEAARVHQPAIVWTWWRSSIRREDTGAYIIARIISSFSGRGGAWASSSQLPGDVPTVLIKKSGISLSSRGTDPANHVELEFPRFLIIEARVHTPAIVSLRDPVALKNRSSRCRERTFLFPVSAVSESGGNHYSQRVIWLWFLLFHEAIYSHGD